MVKHYGIEFSYDLCVARPHTELPHQAQKSALYARQPRLADKAWVLPTVLWCGQEAANHGDVMRLWVRRGVRVNLSFDFSRQLEAHHTSNDKVLYQPKNSISKLRAEKTTCLKRYCWCVAQFGY